MECDPKASREVTLEAPRIELGKPMLVAGFSERHAHPSAAEGIPKQWARFAPHRTQIPGAIAELAHGVCYNFDGQGAFDYLSGVEIVGHETLPGKYAFLQIAAQRYAIFSYPGPIADIRSVMSAIFANWMPASGHQPAEAPMLECYSPAFDAATGLGGFQIWLPIQD
ncbi:MAG: AraC family transcriptional regulator [Candidatus Hydrogenedentes bacterium]|nr:AraC family transcriptional regulator [Candidatus Hydrogenedentota bacterium]